MAHFAKLGLDNVVTEVVAVDTIDCMTRGGIEKEEVGVEFLTKCHGHENWKKCSYNTRAGVHLGEDGLPSGKPGFRANYPAVGWYYNTEHDLFHPPKPKDENGQPLQSHVLNTTTGHWEPSVPKPELTAEQEAIPGAGYTWNESLWLEDNTQGWEYIVVETPEKPVPE